MSDPKDRKPDDPEQSQRFIDMAREVNADESLETFERVFRHVAVQKGEAPKHAATPSRRTGKPASS